MLLWGVSVRQCGHLPDESEHRSADLAERPYIPSGAPWGDVIVQHIGRIHEQPLLPDCTGESIAACIEAQTGSDVSGVDIWREGLRRCGQSPALDRGLAFVPALVGVERRGWTDYRHGEETRLASTAPSLEEELEAADRPGRVVLRYRIPTGSGAMTLPAVDDALARGWGVVFGARVSEDYQALGVLTADVRIGPGMLGNGTLAHAQRIYGRFVESGQRYYLVQNSWGTGWGGVNVNLKPQSGCVAVTAECILAAYDIAVVQVVV